MSDMHRDMRDAYLDSVGVYDVHDDRPSWAEVDAEDADTDNPFAMRARMARAEKLAAEVRLIRMAAEDVIDAQESWWGMVADRAGIRSPSRTTIAMTIGLLASPGLAGLTMPTNDKKGGTE